MDRSFLPVTNDPHIHNETHDHTAVCEPAAIKCKVTGFYNIFLSCVSGWCTWLQRKTPCKEIQPITESILFCFSTNHDVGYVRFPALSTCIGFRLHHRPLNWFMNSATSIFHNYLNQILVLRLQSFWNFSKHGERSLAGLQHKTLRLF